MQEITPCLWFDDQAEDAANFYVSIFKDSTILGVSRFGEGAPRPAGSAMLVSFVSAEQSTAAGPRLGCRATRFRQAHRIRWVIAACRGRCPVDLSGVHYVSRSPFRVPVAPLEAGRANGSGGSDSHTP
jgi:3-demethylubiquinone-9 3-methyltransferase